MMDKKFIFSNRLTNNESAPDHPEQTSSAKILPEDKRTYKTIEEMYTEDEPQIKKKVPDN
jgi:hypothetical protein